MCGFFNEFQGFQVRPTPIATAFEVVCAVISGQMRHGIRIGQRERGAPGSPRVHPEPQGVAVHLSSADG